jgi:hypothetical protein
MSRGDYPIVTGTLSFEPLLGYVLHGEDGNNWVLDIDWNVGNLIDHRVTARGYRYGFDRLDVTEIVKAD